SRVACVGTAIEALQALARDTYELVLADYNTPGMDGLEFLAKLSALELRVPVVFITSLGNERIAVEPLKSGAYDYVVKDSRYLEMLPTLAERAISSFRIERRLEEARRQLAESEDRYRSLVHSLDAIVWEADPITLQFRFVSQRAERILGYP